MSAVYSYLINVQIFTAVCKLNWHIRNECLRKFSCDVCNKYFCGEYELKRHIKTVHNHEKVTQKSLTPKPYACEMCPKAFAEPSKLKVHIRTHTGERPSPCVQCCKAFSEASKLKKHVLSMHMTD